MELSAHHYLSLLCSSVMSSYVLSTITSAIGTVSFVQWLSDALLAKGIDGPVSF